MNKAIKILSFLVLFFIGLGTLCKMMHWPGGAFILTFGFFFLLAGFLPLFGVYRYKNSDTSLERVIVIIGVLSLHAIFVGYLFKMNHWPGGSFATVIGFYSFCFVALPLYIFSRSKTAEKKTREVIKLVFIGLIVVIFIFLQNLTPSINTLNTFGLIAKQQQIANVGFDYISLNQDKQLNEQNRNKAIENFEYEISEIILLIETIKIEIIEIADGKGCEAIEGKRIHGDLIRAKDNIDVPKYVLFGSNIRKSDGKADILKSKLQDFKNNTLMLIETSLPSSNSALSVDIEHMLATESVRNRYTGKMTNWEEYMFYGTPLIGTISILNSIENNVKAVEIIIKHELLNR